MSQVVTEFTAQVPEWRPYITPIELASASPEQLEALKVTPSNTKVSDYVLVLAHDPDTLKPRTPLFNDIMYHRGGLSRAERELGAVAASLVNRCIYCAAVHASRYNQLSKNTDTMQAVLADPDKAELDTRQRAIVDFSLTLSQCPPSAEQTDLNALRQAGLDDLEVVDLVLASALFGWANRLMHTLGEPIQADSNT